MDETIEKKVLEESSSDFSILSLFFQADLVVKIVIIVLIFSSIWSWAIIFSKYTSLKNILLETEEFEDNFYGSETLSKLSKKLGSQPTHPIEAVFFSAMVYFDKVKSGFSNKNFEYKNAFCENVKKEMLIVINKELSGLEKGLNFLASVGSTCQCSFGLYFLNKVLIFFEIIEPPIVMIISGIIWGSPIILSRVLSIHGIKSADFKLALMEDETII